jgi:hypothetical protein
MLHYLPASRAAILSVGAAARAKKGERKMKKMVLLSLLIGVFTLTASAQLTFTVRPGKLINNAELGYRMRSLIPYAGCDIVWMTASFQSDWSDESYESWEGETYRDLHTEHMEYDGSAFLFIPHLGAKYCLNPNLASGKMIPYAKGSLFFSIPIVKAHTKEQDDQWYYHNGLLEDHYGDTNEWDLEDNPEEADFVKDILSFWGLDLGFGCEYFFSDNFSLGGEFGLRMLFDKIKYKNEDSWQSGDPNSPYYQREKETWDDNISLTFKITQAAFALNYYF